MEPKDLKNPDGLKSTAKENLEKTEKEILSKKEEVVKDETVEKTEVTAEELVTESTKATEKGIAEDVIDEKITEVTSEVEEVAKKLESEVIEEPVVEKVKEVDEKLVSEDITEEKVIEAENPEEKKENEVVANEVIDEKITEAALEVEEIAEKLESEVIEEPVKENLAEVAAKLVSEDITEEKGLEAENPEEKKEDEVVAEKEEAKEKEVVEESAETVTETKPIEAKTESDEPALQAKDDITEEKDISAEKVSKETTKEIVAEKQKTQKPKEIVKEKIDYSKLSQIELVNALRDILDNYDNRDIKHGVETIKAVFYKNFNENIEKVKKQFIEDGGAEEDFKPESDPYENDIKDLLKRYRYIRIEFNKKLEVDKEENLKLKYEVIERIKGLINNEESINKTFHEFRDLQRDWREIGLVPQSKMKNLWDTYHFHVENFYDYIKINRELRDLDLKKNLEAKINLCERAEELLIEPSVIKAFNTLQKYHEQWREIGPVPVEQKDDIWERFKAATSKINKKHQEFFENRKVDQKKNLEAKTALCEKVEEINIEEIANHRDWDIRSRELVELQKVWRTIGFAPRKDNNKIYDRFRGACDKFFDAKREFYSKNKEVQQNNLQLKIDLCAQAESLKDNTDWRKTTQDFINIQKKWKEIGPVPRKHSDSVWKRFRAACDYFFEKKSEHFSSIDTEQVDNLKKKEDLIEEVLNFKPDEDVNENLKLLKSFQRRWTEVGHVPIKSKDDIQTKFRDAINKLFDDLNIDESKRNLLKFRSKMTSFSESSRGQNKMRMERDKYMNKLKQLEGDLILLDNNIGFFAKSKNAESLIADVKKKTEVTRQKIEFLKDKIRVIDDMDKSED